MASSKDYLVYILDLLKGIPGINYKKMMGEYLLYKNAILFGGIYDDRFLVKNTKSLCDLNLKEVIPYPSAKAMLLVDTEDSDEMADIINKVVKDLNQ